MIRNKSCHQCERPAIRIDQFDSYACKECMIWLEEGCDDPSCPYCFNRPATPINVDWYDEWNT